MKKIISSPIIIITFLFLNESIAQNRNLCHEGSGSGPCFFAEIVEKTKELKLVAMVDTIDVTLMFKYLNSPEQGQKIYSDGKNKLLVYFDGDHLFSIELLTNIKFGIELYLKGLYSEPADE